MVTTVEANEERKDIICQNLIDEKEVDPQSRDTIRKSIKMPLPRFCKNPSLRNGSTKHVMSNVISRFLVNDSRLLLFSNSVDKGYPLDGGDAHVVVVVSSSSNWQKEGKRVR